MHLRKTISRLFRRKQPAVWLSFDESLPKELFDEFREEMSAAQIDFSEETRRAERSQAGFEWLVIPAAVVVLTKPYFDAFMKEAGKDHYHALKNALCKLRKHFFGRERSVNVKLASTPGKLAKEERFSWGFALYAEIYDERKVKLLIRDNCTEQNYREAIELFVEMVRIYYSGSTVPEHLVDLAHAKDYWRTVLVAYDDEAHVLREMNPIPKPKSKKPTV